MKTFFTHNIYTQLMKHKKKIALKTNTLSLNMYINMYNTLNEIQKLLIQIVKKIAKIFFYSIMTINLPPEHP